MSFFFAIFAIFCGQFTFGCGFAALRSFALFCGQFTFWLRPAALCTSRFQKNSWAIWGAGRGVCNWPDFWYALCLNYDLYAHQ